MRAPADLEQEPGRGPSRRLPHLRAVAIGGVPADAKQFIRAGADGRVPGLSDVFAAGDATSFSVKKGGIAAEQADAVARAIARMAGVDVAADPLKPVLRGKLLTGSGSWFITNGHRAECPSHIPDSVSACGPREGFEFEVRCRPFRGELGVAVVQQRDRLEPLGEQLS